MAVYIDVIVDISVNSLRSYFSIQGTGGTVGCGDGGLSGQCAFRKR